MDTKFMNSKNSKTSDSHRQLLNLLDKVNLKEVTNMLLYQTLAFTIHGKKEKSYKNNKFKITLNISLKNMIQLLIVLQ